MTTEISKNLHYKFDNKQSKQASLIIHNPLLEIETTPPLAASKQTNQTNVANYNFIKWYLLAC